MSFNRLLLRQISHSIKSIKICGPLFVRLAIIEVLDFGSRLHEIITILLALVEELVITAIVATLSAIVSFFCGQLGCLLLSRYFLLSK